MIINKLKYLLLVLVASISSLATSNAANDTITVNVSQPGALSAMIILQGVNPASVEKLRVSGTLNEIDWKDIKMKMTKIKYLDLKHVTNEEIPDSLFCGNTVLQNIVFPDSLCLIGQDAFNGCSKLDMPCIFSSTLYNIGQRAFLNTNIPSLYIPSLNKQMNGFDIETYHCNVRYPSYQDTKNREQTISFFAEYGDSLNMESWNIDWHDDIDIYVDNVYMGSIRGDSHYLVSYWSYCFQATGNHTIRYKLRETSYRDIGITTKIYRRKSSIGIYAFANNPKLKHIFIGDNVSFGGFAFEGAGFEQFKVGNKCRIASKAITECPMLEKVEIGDSAYISSQAFCNNPQLNQCIFGKKTELGEGVFDMCLSLQDVKFLGSNIIGNFFHETPSKLKNLSIGKRSKIKSKGFFEVELENLYLGDSITFYDSAFYSSKIQGDLVIRKGSLIYRCAFYQSSFRSIDLEDGISRMDSYSFASTSCKSCKITIPASIESVPFRCFYDCQYIDTLVIQEGVKAIESDAFCSCSNLKSVQLPSSLEILCNCCFENCKSLESIDLPSSVIFHDYYWMHLGKGGVFYGCTGLKTINVHSQRPPVIADDTFYKVDYDNCELNVPFGTAFNFLTTNGWRDFWRIKELFGTLNINTSSGGTVSYRDHSIIGDYETEFMATDTLRFKIHPSSGYELANVYINDTLYNDKIHELAFEIVNPTSNITVNVEFSPCSSIKLIKYESHPQEAYDLLGRKINIEKGCHQLFISNKTKH